jgi:hypothetical protein
MNLISRLLRGTFLVAAVMAVTACAPMSYGVKAPTPSGLKYEGAAQAKTDISLIDNRPEKERVFSSGILPAALTVDNAPLDAPQFLAKHLQQELVSRGVPVQISNGGKGAPRINLSTFRIQNHRVSGFSPFVTLTFLSADLETAQGKKRLGVFVKAGKVPVWSFDEVVDPTFNQPLSIAVKELASKIAVHLHGYRASDSTVDQLVAKLAQRSPASYLDVYSLGMTNNTKAVDTIAKLVDDGDEYVRLAAISSLGNLRAATQFERLKSVYQNRSGLWQDRAMALKSIGDLGTDQARAFLAEEAKRWSEGPSNNEANWTLQIIRLYS